MKEWKDFFLDFITSNWPTKLISVFIAMVLWAAVLLSRNIEETKEIPLQIITPKDLTVGNDEDIPERIAFILSGPQAYLRLIGDRKEDPILVNLSASTKAGPVTHRFFQDSLRVPIGVKVIAIQPASITVKLERKRTKEVPVRPQLEGKLPEGFEVVDQKIFPEKISIRGAESKLNRVKEIFTVPISISELRGEQEIKTSLDLGLDRLELVSSEPKLFLKIAPTSANLRLRKIDLEVQADSRYVLSSRDKQVTLYVRAPENMVSNFQSSTVKAFIDLRGKSPGTVQAKVQAVLPPQVYLVKSSPETVRVKILEK